MSTLPDYAQALQQALHGIRSMQRSESVPLDIAGGRVLAENVVADRDLPPFNRAQMDGYAIRAAEFAPGREFPVCAAVPAGATADIKVPNGHVVAIATGAPLPPNLDTVIQHEHSDRGDRRGRAVRFTVESIKFGAAVHVRGSDAPQGQILLQSGTILAAQHLGIAAAVGVTHVQVRAKPRTAVLTSGDEVVSMATASSEMLPHQIRNSNGPMVGELLRRFGAAHVLSMHVADQREPTVDAVKNAVANHDLVITVGGVSAGDRDFFPIAFDACQIKRSLQGASIQPGRPIVVGHAPNGCIVIGLPGNPVSALACACLFAWPIVRMMLGLEPTLPWRDVELAESVKPNPHRRAFRPAMIQSDGRATVPAWAGSGDLAHTSGTSGLVELPIQTEAVEAGRRLRFLPWPTSC